MVAKRSDRVFKITKIPTSKRDALSVSRDKLYNSHRVIVNLALKTLLAVAAFQWRKLAERAAERQKRSWPLVPEAVRPN